MWWERDGVWGGGGGTGNAVGKLLGNTAAPKFRGSSGVIYRWPVREFMQIRQEEIRPARKLFRLFFTKWSIPVGWLTATTGGLDRSSKCEDNRLKTLKPRPI